MKKALLLVAMGVLAVALLAGCSDSSTTTGETTATEGAGTVGDYDVIIKNHEITTSFEEDQAILVFFDFTNNAEEPISFFGAVQVDAYQNGVALEYASVINDQYDTTVIESKNIQKGTTLEVYKAWILPNTTDPVDVVVTEFLGMTNDKITKTFTLQ